LERERECKQIYLKVQTKRNEKGKQREAYHIYKNSKQTKCTSKVTISPLNKKKKKVSYWTVGQSHLNTCSIILPWKI
jgi:hypothetical protein